MEQASWYASGHFVLLNNLWNIGTYKLLSNLSLPYMHGTTLFSSFILGPLASILVGKFGARAVAVSGGLFASSGLILSAFAKELAHLYFTFGFLTGMYNYSE